MLDMPTVNIDSHKINYKIEGNGKPVVLLHGWGQNLKMMDFVFNHLKNNFKVLSFDFIGFGNSEQPKTSFSVDDYVDCLKKMLDYFEMENPILIAHSFGCRVAIKYASKYKVHKMVLTGAAGIKPSKSLTDKMRIAIYKTIKNTLTLFHLFKLKDRIAELFGSADYKNTDGIMRETFVKVVNDDVMDVLGLITCPVLLVWGENDEAVPLAMGKLMEEKMKDAALVVFENDDHFAYYHQWSRFNRVLDAMLKGDVE